MAFKVCKLYFKVALQGPFWFGGDLLLHLIMSQVEMAKQWGMYCLYFRLPCFFFCCVLARAHASVIEASDGSDDASVIKGSDGSDDQAFMPRLKPEVSKVFFV